MADGGKGVHVATLKNVEGDRPVSLRTLAMIYRDGLRGKNAISAEEWHKVVAYWLLSEFPEGLSMEAMGAGIAEVEREMAGAERSRRGAVLQALEKMDEADAATFAELTRALAGRRGPALFAAVRALLAL